MSLCWDSADFSFHEIYLKAARDGGALATVLHIDESTPRSEPSGSSVVGLPTVREGERDVEDHRGQGAGEGGEPGGSDEAQGKGRITIRREKKFQSRHTIEGV